MSRCYQQIDSTCQNGIARLPGSIGALAQESTEWNLSASGPLVVLSNPGATAPMNARMPYTAGYAPAFNLSNVADVQRAINVLRQSGFLHREAVLKPLADDGQMGAYTRAAITAFQEAIYLPYHRTPRLDDADMLAQVLGELGIHADANTPPTTVGGAPMNIGSISDVQAALNLLRPGSVDRPDGGSASRPERRSSRSRRRTCCPPRATSTAHPRDDCASPRRRWASQQSPRPLRREQPRPPRRWSTARRRSAAGGLGPPGASRDRVSLPSRTRSVTC